MWNIVGHERLVAGLTRSLQSGRLAHAYLFAGPQGVGKLTLARAFAQALLCTEAERPCSKCRSCRRVAEGKHADVTVISVDEAAQEEGHKVIGIEKMDELDRTANLGAFEGNCKIFIIDGAEQLSGNAANRLLKTLEEPPPNVYLLLVSSALERVLPTVLSRCRLHELRPVPAATLTAALAERGCAPERAQLLAQLAEGRVGWALSAAQNPSMLEERSAALAPIAALTYEPYYRRLSFAGELAADYSKRREHVRAWLALARQWWRDMLLVKGGRGELVINMDHRDELVQTAAKLPLESIAAALRELDKTEEYLDRNVNARLALDVLMLRLPLLTPSRRMAA